MFVIPDEMRFPITDHLRVTDKMLALVHQLGRGPASCDHHLIGGTPSRHTRISKQR